MTELLVSSLPLMRFCQDHSAPPMTENFASQLGRRMATYKSSPDPTWTRNYFRIRKETIILSSSFVA
jgi:hypothetical protein